MFPRYSLKRNCTNGQQQHDASTTINNKRNNERTPLLDSACVTESIVNTSLPDLQTGVSWGVAAFLLVNTALGAGMLNYPYAYNQIGGVLAAAVMQVVLLFFIAATMFILVYCADFNQDVTYHDVLMSMCGKRAQQISAMSILLTCYGINITFLVIIGDQYDRIFNSLSPEYVDELWYLDRKFTIMMTAILFIWPMCYAQRLDFLRHASILGMFAMLYVAFLTVYEHYKLDEATIAAGLASPHSLEAKHGHDNSNNNNINGSVSVSNTISTETTTLLNDQAGSIRWFLSLTIIPVLCFAYQTHEVIVPVYACMKQRHIGHFMKASIFGLVILFFLYNIVGAYGYMTFGENVGPDIITLYDAKDPIVVVALVALMIKFITTYPPLMFCGRGALDGLYGEFRKLTPDEFKSSEKARRIVITTIWFFSTVAIAVFAPDISVTLQLLGSMASINVFVFPGMCLISLTRRLRRTRLNPITTTNNCHISYTICSYRLATDSDMNVSYSNKDLSIDKSNGITNNSHRHNAANAAYHQRLQNGNSWHNRSTGSLLERLGSSIAPSTVAQLGISRCTAILLYLFAALLITFGIFIFILELINVFGF